MTLLRAALFNAGFCVWTLVLGIIGLPVLLLPRRTIVAFSGFWATGALKWLRLSVGLDHEVVGAENIPAGPAIIAVKHQSAWDTLILNRIFPDPAIVLKRELTYIPVFGWFLAANGMIAVDRQAGAKALRDLVTQARAAVESGRSIVIFPEGTRAPVGETLPFHPGVAALYRELGLPMLPVALNSGLFWGRRHFLKRSGRIRLQILPAIAPGLDRKLAILALQREIDRASRKLAGLEPRPDEIGVAPPELGSRTGVSGEMFSREAGARAELTPGSEQSKNVAA